MIRHIFAITTFAGLAIGILLPTSAAFAFDVPSVLTGGQNIIQTTESTTGVNLQQILAASGLNTQKYAACTSPALLGELAGIYNNFKSIVQDEINATIQDFYQNVLQHIGYCAIADADPEVFGFKPPNPLPKCTATVTSDTKAFLQRLKQREEQSSLIAGCISRLALKHAANTAASIIQTSGPYGSSGPDWVTSWENLPGEAADRARKQFYTELVNTDICPYMRDRVFTYFRVPKDYIDNPPSLEGIESADGTDSFRLRAQCTLPDGFTPENMSAATRGLGSWAAVEVMAQPQNNFEGILDLAQAELAKRTDTLVTAAMADAISGGGYQSINDCLTWTPDHETCLSHGPNKQTGGTVRDQQDAIFKAQVDHTNSQQQAVDDIEAEIANRLFNLANRPLPLHIELSPSLNPEKYTQPTSTPIPTPIDPICANIDPTCTCLAGDTFAQEALAPWISDSIARAMQVNPECFTSGSSQITYSNACPDNRYVLQAICERMQSAATSVCIPSPTSDTQIVILGGGGPSISVDVITSDGFVRTNGGEPVASCPSGVQD